MKKFNRSQKLALALASVTLPAAASTAVAEDYCREYTRTVTIGGERQSAYGTACQQPDGSWKIVSNEHMRKANAKETVVIHKKEPRNVTKIVTYIEEPHRHYRKKHRHSNHNARRQHKWQQHLAFNTYIGW